MQKSRYIALPESNPANPKVNRAKAQFRPKRDFDCSSNRQVVSWCYRNAFVTPKQLAPFASGRGKTRSEVGVFLIRN
jgi:hypothetical protein